MKGLKEETIEVTLKKGKFNDEEYKYGRIVFRILRICFQVRFSRLMLDIRRNTS